MPTIDQGATPAGSKEDISQLAEIEEEGGLIFELAWVSDSTAGERWLIIEDTLAEELMREAAQPT